MSDPIRTASFPLSASVAGLSALAVLAALSGCSSVEGILSGDKVEYKSSTPARPTPLDVPPDLTQLTRDPRYQQQGGAVSATRFEATQAAAQPRGAQVATASTGSTVPAVAPANVGDMHIERAGSERWLVTGLTPEQLWPQLKAFWEERGLVIGVDQPDAGVMETEWAENRSKLPNDFIRNTIGKVFDSAYDTGERDKFRTRVERGATGTEIYISHRGMVEVYTTERKDQTIWQPRPTDPQLEGEMLSRLMLKLGGNEAKNTVLATANASAGSASAPAGSVVPAGPPARARILSGQPAATMQVDENFDRAWRRVGLALDRTGFTVEDRDRSGGLYFVRYVDPANVGKEEPGFFSRLFGRDKNGPTGPVRYRIALKTAGEATTVSVLNTQGAPEAGEAGQKIVSLLVDDLK